MSSTTISSARQIRATIRAVEASTLARPMVAVSVSRVNQRDPQAGVDHGVGEGFDEVGLAGAGRAGDGQVLGPADPFQGA